jgi:hypothetical protein
MTMMILHNLASQSAPTAGSLPTCAPMSVFRVSDRACYVTQGE